LADAVIDWIEQRFQPRACDSAEFFYDAMESQSDRCLPVIYQEFDVSKKAHWRDRGAILDFLFSTDGAGRRLLDFGPGDGWPSLLIAPFAREIVGVEGSRKRREVCEQNADRLGIANATFVYCGPGNALPFADRSFDGAMAASSVEQTPDPRATLAELFRVLKAGGRLRIMYEDLERYRNGREQEVFIESLGEESSRLVIYDRDIVGERAKMLSLVISLPAPGVHALLEQPERLLQVDAMTDGRLERLEPYVVDAHRCMLSHPSGATLARWLGETGFTTVLPTLSGIDAAGDLFEQSGWEQRPGSPAELDRLLRPAVERAVRLWTDLSKNPPITAVK
jgi:SAM-dependent methyltransferase